MQELRQFGEIPPFVRPGQSRRKHTLAHARKETIQRRYILTHNAYIITQLAFARVPTGQYPPSLQSGASEQKREKRRRLRSRAVAGELAPAQVRMIEQMRIRFAHEILLAHSLPNCAPATT